MSSSALAQVQHYYVSSTGNDAGAGTQASPWRTIGRADSALSVGSGGTIVHVAPGTYNLSGDLTTRKSGTGPGVKVRFQCDTYQACKISWTGGGTWLLLGNWSQVVNFELAGNSVGSTAVDILGNHTDVIGNYVHDFTGGGCQLTGAITENGNQGATTGGLISGNKVINVGPTSGCNNQHGIYTAFNDTVVTNNIIGRISTYGIHAHGWNCREVISNNTIFNTGKGGIILAQGTTVPGCTTQDYITVTNNIIANVGSGNPGNGSGIAFGSSGSSGSCSGQGIGTHDVIAGNLMYGNAPGNFNLCTGGGYNPAAISGSNATVFVNYQANGSGDYHLQSNSGAAGAGSTTCAAGVSGCVPLVDMAGLTRALPPSIGVYEVAGGSASSMPSPPTGLTAVVQ